MYLYTYVSAEDDAVCVCVRVDISKSSKGHDYRRVRARVRAVNLCYYDYLRDLIKLVLIVGWSYYCVTIILSFQIVCIKHARVCIKHALCVRPESVHLTLSLILYSVHCHLIAI